MRPEPLRFQTHHYSLSFLESCTHLGPAGSRRRDRIEHVKISLRETPMWEEMGRAGQSGKAVMQVSLEQRRGREKGGWSCSRLRADKRSFSKDAGESQSQASYHTRKVHPGCLQSLAG